MKDNSTFIKEKDEVLLPQPTADAALLLEPVAVVHLRNHGAAKELVPAGVGGVRGQAVTEAAALAAELAIMMTVCLGQLGAVVVQVHAGLRAGSDGGGGGAVHRVTYGDCQDPSNTAQSDSSL